MEDANATVNVEAGVVAKAEAGVMKLAAIAPVAAVAAAVAGCGR